MVESVALKMNIYFIGHSGRNTKDVDKILAQKLTELLVFEVPLPH